MTDVHNSVSDRAHLAVPVADLVLDPKPHRIHPPEEIESLKRACEITERAFGEIVRRERIMRERVGCADLNL